MCERCRAAQDCVGVLYPSGGLVIRPNSHAWSHRAPKRPDSTLASGKNMPAIGKQPSRAFGGAVRHSSPCPSVASPCAKCAIPSLSTLSHPKPIRATSASSTTSGDRPLLPLVPWFLSTHSPISPTLPFGQFTTLFQSLVSNTRELL